MKTILTMLLLTCTTAFASPPPWANNPDAEDMPEQAECSFCDDDTPDAPIDSYLVWGGIAAIALGVYKLKN